MTADPSGQELTLGERVDYTRARLLATQRERYERELREATEQALTMGTTARLAVSWNGGGEQHGWRTMVVSPGRGKRLVEEGRWDELFPSRGRGVDEVVEELLRGAGALSDRGEARVRR